ncbi:MAG: DUF4268 domain-containing protein [Proteobacteria bacterium]|nr:DUF4268 domain-containing protein [Pseudomonadota bacterium]
MKQQLGDLITMKLTDIWETEDKDFTPWLVEDKNLELLGKAIGIDLDFEESEKYVGPFRADILCKNMDDDSWVVIENQFGKTDHKHLGQLLTYAAGLKAATIVWIAAKFKKEHYDALKQLNKITDENFRFFGVEVEIWKIDDSKPAVKFNVVLHSDKWSKRSSRTARKISGGGKTKVEMMQHKYWQHLVKYLSNQNSKLKPQTPIPWPAQRFSLGKGGTGIVAKIYTRKKRLAVEIDLNHSDHSKAVFHLLMKDKEAIERELGADFNLEWQELPEQTRSRIDVYKDADPADDKDWENQHAWFKETVEKFDSAFRGRIKNINPSDWNPESDTE